MEFNQKLHVKYFIFMIIVLFFWKSTKQSIETYAVMALYKYCCKYLSDWVIYPLPLLYVGRSQAQTVRDNAKRHKIAYAAQASILKDF